MRAQFRLAMLTLVVTLLAARAVCAAPITVAEFRWDITLDETSGCSILDLSCVLSTFSLTDLWDGPLPGSTLTNNRLSLATGDPLFFLDLEAAFPLNFDQLAQAGLSTFATISTSFLYAGEIVTLGATLTQPGTFAVLQFDPSPVPEPGTLGLVALGVLALASRTRRAARRL